MLKRYKTVKGYGEFELIIQKSKFIAYVERTETEEAAVEFINKIKKLHRSATHNCSAYLIGEHDEIQKANDDGEPSGTAGVPMLEVLKKQGLKDTTVVVTRYFGGIKLGGGGLIRAYGKSTSEGLKATGIVERILHKEIIITIDYTLLGKIENEVRNSPYPLLDISYTDLVQVIIHVPTDEVPEAIAWITELSNGQADIKEDITLYRELDFTEE
ncbi:YigZ family protein [Bacillus coahuilensis]|uniref:YigZ family protein n=1 Tax=Bacillus coahuilensis TaxID=408580 RepID=UPI0001851335|nr:YigZ family protein [Bacillus coahuilensis]